MMMAKGWPSLNPNADMWSFARPLLASDWISSEDNIRAQIDRVFSDLRQLYLKLPQILEKLDKPAPQPTPKMALFCYRYLGPDRPLQRPVCSLKCEIFTNL